jgi:hypothetical protein
MIDELKVEVEMYRQECIRLRSMLDAQITESELKKLFDQRSWRSNNSPNIIEDLQH